MWEASGNEGPCSVAAEVVRNLLSPATSRFGGDSTAGAALALAGDPMESNASLMHCACILSSLVRSHRPAVGLAMHKEWPPAVADHPRDRRGAHDRLPGAARAQARRRAEQARRAAHAPGWSCPCEWRRRGRRQRYDGELRSADACAQAPVQWRHQALHRSPGA